MSRKPQDGLVARSRYAETRDKVPSRWSPSADLSLAPLCSLSPCVWQGLRLYAMKRDGLVRVSKIDVDALLDKNKSFGEGVILFPRSTSAAVTGRYSRILVSSKRKGSCAITPNPNGRSSCTLTIP